jgi:hypothetical protein
MKIEKLKTSKLFYNKWPYKVTCKIEHARNVLSRVRYHSYTYARNGMTDEEREDIEKFRKAIKPFINKNIKCRAEYYHFNIFCDDKILLEKISKRLKPWIQKIYGPSSDEELEYLKANGHKKRVCERFAKGKYQYRVYFKTSTPDTIKESFLNWSSNYEGKIEISGTTKKWLNRDRKWSSNPFMYVLDSSTLSMVGLFLANNIKLVEEFVLRESINTPSE